MTKQPIEPSMRMIDPWKAIRKMGANDPRMGSYPPTPVFFEENVEFHHHSQTPRPLGRTPNCDNGIPWYLCACHTAHTKINNPLQTQPPKTNHNNDMVILELLVFSNGIHPAKCYSKDFLIH
jgi:hypothetical protein